MRKSMSGAQKDKKIIEQQLKDGKHPKLDSYFTIPAEFTSENTPIVTSVLKILYENPEKNNVTNIYLNINNTVNTDACDILLSSKYGKRLHKTVFY
jgi:hypothetical protein